MIVVGSGTVVAGAVVEVVGAVVVGGAGATVVVTAGTVDVVGGRTVVEGANVAAGVVAAGDAAGGWVGAGAEAAESGGALSGGSTVASSSAGAAGGRRVVRGPAGGPTGPAPMIDVGTDADDVEVVVVGGMGATVGLGAVVAVAPVHGEVVGVAVVPGDGTGAGRLDSGPSQVVISVSSVTISAAMTHLATVLRVAITQPVCTAPDRHRAHHRTSS